MNLFDNGCYMWDGLVLGMARALISEAEHILDEEDCHIYDSILYKIDESCIDTQAVDLLVHTARTYCEAGLLCNEFEEDKQEEGFDLFYDLYFGNQHHLLQDNEITNEFYEKYQKIFERTPNIGESVDGDIRVFFE